MCLRLLANNVLSGATITATPTPNASFPLANLWINRRSRFVRFAASNQVITCTFPAATSVDTVFLRARVACTGRVQLYGNTAMTAVLYDSGASADLGYPFYTPTPIDVRAIKITFSANSPGAGYIDIDQLFAGLAFAPRYGADYGVSISSQASWEVKRTLTGGAVLVGAAAAWREMTLQLSSVSDAERAQLAMLHASRELVVIDPYSTAETMRYEHFMVGYLSPLSLAQKRFDATEVKLVINELSEPYSTRALVIIDSIEGYSADASISLIAGSALNLTVRATALLPSTRITDAELMVDFVVTSVSKTIEQEMTISPGMSAPKPVPGKFDVNFSVTVPERFGTTVYQAKVRDQWNNWSAWSPILSITGI